MSAGIRFSASVNRPQAAFFLLTAEDPVPASLPAPVRQALDEMLKRPEFRRNPGQIALSILPDTKQRLYAVGLGAKKDFSAGVLREAGAATARAASEAGLQRLRIELAPASVPGEFSAARCARLLAEGLGLSRFSFDRYKGAASAEKKKTSKMEIGVPSPWLRPARDALTLTDAVNYARTLGATPPADAHPAFFASEARRLARKTGLKCRVLGVKEARREGMGGLLAVGAGGSSPPCLIVLEYRPRGAKRQPICLVGKTITFDTGGYSIKPMPGMAGMKYDKCGGMAVLGAMHAVAALKPRVPVTGVLAVAENMIDREAYRPDDIVRFCNGVTCEITNTDAEGRLVLADALAWATQKLNPAAVIDLATLTGGVVVALGPYCAGYFCNDEKLRGRLEAAAENSGDKIWHLPLWPEHRKQMAGHHADLVNSQGRDAHPIQGAAFLSHFVGAGAPKNLPTLPWAHVDIAGVATTEKDGPLFGKGPTGFGVRLLYDLILDWS